MAEHRQLRAAARTGMGNELQTALASWRCGRHSWEPWGESGERARAAFAGLVGVPATDAAIGRL